MFSCGLKLYLPCKLKCVNVEVAVDFDNGVPSPTSLLDLEAISNPFEISASIPRQPVAQEL